MDTQINTRIKEILNFSELTPTAFATEIGISRSNLAHILSGRNQPSFAMMEKILKAFPEIRGEWLITGLGEMLKSEAEMSSIQPMKPKSAATVQPMAELPFDEIEDGNDSNLVDTTLKSEQELSPIEDEEFTDEETPVVEAPAVHPLSRPEKKNTQEIPATPQRAPRRATRPPQRETPVVSIQKKVRKIVFFYTDNSFEEYFPE